MKIRFISEHHVIEKDACYVPDRGDIVVVKDRYYKVKSVVYEVMTGIVGGHLERLSKEEVCE